MSTKLRLMLPGADGQVSLSDDREMCGGRSPASSVRSRSASNFVAVLGEVGEPAAADHKRRRGMTDCIVVGAGPAGLATSAALCRYGVDHVVLERGRIGETWRSQRWDSFRLNTPGWANRLLGEQPSDACQTGLDVVARLERLAADCPVREGVRVDRLWSIEDGFVLRSGNGELRSRTVVVASGDENEARFPVLSQAFPPRLRQVHAAEYRNPAQLPAGGVLVVGSAQTGCQITEELLAAGRRVILATCAVGRAPTPYRGRDTAEWLFEAGFFDHRPQDLPDPAMMRSRVPILAPGGRSLSLQLLARAGARLAGRLVAVDGERVRFDTSAPANVSAGDTFAGRAGAMIDQYILRSGVDAPPAEPDTAGGTIDLDPPTEIDLYREGIGSILWCTGFGSDFTWLDPTLLDADVRPRREGAAGGASGLWFMGLRWLTHRGSAQLAGMTKDAESVARAVSAQVSNQSGRG